MILLTLLMAMQVAPGSPPAKAPNVLSVCDVLLNDPTRLNGKAVRVRGYLTWDAHGESLGGDCKSHLVTKGLAWANYISVYVDAADEGISRSWEQIRTAGRRLHVDWERDRVWVTIVGRLETRPTMDDAVVQRPYGLARAGFGMGGEPAEINVISVEDIKVERGPIDPSRFDVQPPQDQTR
jgi:hypothetical protein